MKKSVIAEANIKKIKEEVQEIVEKGTKKIILNDIHEFSMKIMKDKSVTQYTKALYKNTEKSIKDYYKNCNLYDLKSIIEFLNYVEEILSIIYKVYYPIIYKTNVILKEIKFKSHLYKNENIHDEFLYEIMGFLLENLSIKTIDYLINIIKNTKNHPETGKFIQNIFSIILKYQCEAIYKAEVSEKIINIIYEEFQEHLQSKKETNFFINAFIYFSNENSQIYYQFLPEIRGFIYTKITSLITEENVMSSFSNSEKLEKMIWLFYESNNSNIFIQHLKKIYDSYKKESLKEFSEKEVLSCLHNLRCFTDYLVNSHSENLNLVDFILSKNKEVINSNIEYLYNYINYKHHLYILNKTSNSDISINEQMIENVIHASYVNLKNSNVDLDNSSLLYFFKECEDKYKFSEFCNLYISQRLLMRKTTIESERIFISEMKKNVGSNWLHKTDILINDFEKYMKYGSNELYLLNYQRWPKFQSNSIKYMDHSLDKFKKKCNKIVNKTYDLVKYVWSYETSTCITILNGCLITMTLVQYFILIEINKNRKNETEIAQLLHPISISNHLGKMIQYNLIMASNEGGFTINNTFFEDECNICPDILTIFDVYEEGKVINISKDKQTGYIIDSYIMKFMKKNKNCKIQTLLNTCKNNLDHVETDKIEKRIEKLKENDMLKIEGDVVQYIP